MARFKELILFIFLLLYTPVLPESPEIIMLPSYAFFCTMDEIALCNPHTFTFINRKENSYTFNARIAKISVDGMFDYEGPFSFAIYKFKEVELKPQESVNVEVVFKLTHSFETATIVVEMETLSSKSIMLIPLAGVVGY